MSFEYLEAAKALRRISQGQAGVKNAVFNAEARNVRRVYAIVSEASKHIQNLKNWINQCPGFVQKIKHQKVDEYLIYIMLYELFYGAGKIKGGGQVKRLIKEYEDSLRKLSGITMEQSLELQKQKQLEQQQNRLLLNTLNNNATDISPLEASAQELTSTTTTTSSTVLTTTNNRPRYIRVNTIQITVDKVITLLCDTTLSPTKQALKPETIIRSTYIPTLLILPSIAHTILELHKHPLVLNGSIILQDFASSIPAHVLLNDIENNNNTESIPLSFDVIDACAAPGNKTSQVAALLHERYNNLLTTSNIDTTTTTTLQSNTKKNKNPNNKANPSKLTIGKVYAFDRSSSRLELLQKRMNEAHATNVIANCQDFLTVDPSLALYTNLYAILLDPSCSGSGMRPFPINMYPVPEAVVPSNLYNNTHSVVPSISTALSISNSTKRARDDDHNTNTVQYIPPAPLSSDLDRVKSLSEFQRKALIHALSFPQVQRVVYSTCSLYMEEDEHVVATALHTYNATVTDPNQHAYLIPCLPTWPYRGYSDEDTINSLTTNHKPNQNKKMKTNNQQEDTNTNANKNTSKTSNSNIIRLTKEEALCCVRCDQNRDGTTGFFVALIVKGKKQNISE